MTQRKKYPNWQLRHEGVLRWIIEHPAGKQKECAKALGYSPSQISRIMNSPEFDLRFQVLRDMEFNRIIQCRVQAYGC